MIKYNSLEDLAESLNISFQLNREGQAMADPPTAALMLIFSRCSRMAKSLESIALTLDNISNQIRERNSILSQSSHEAKDFADKMSAIGASLFATAAVEDPPAPAQICTGQPDCICEGCLLKSGEESQP